jgi:hypothetical protein
MFKLQIETSNAAFVDDTGAEIARILRRVAQSAENIGQLINCEIYIRDANGNKVGSWSYEESE